MSLSSLQLISLGSPGANPTWPISRWYPPGLLQVLVIAVLQAPLRIILSFIKDYRQLRFPVLQKELDQSLKQVVEMRWNTTLAMLQSVNNALRPGKLHEILLRRNDLCYLNNIDCDLLKDIIKLLKPFDEATRHLSTEQTPTLHLVLLTKATLLRGLSIQDGHSAVMKEVLQYISDFCC
ncbi:hypothetical protein XENOCAPTIV_010801 [Xenoophorus captivus]|uniref:Uncharacterized protein n=1 Tax=Xenoophorus captivus TaxID=1517983 RepID=A0ABV0QZY3_9TELE